MANHFRQFFHQRILTKLIVCFTIAHLLTVSYPVAIAAEPDSIHQNSGQVSVGILKTRTNLIEIVDTPTGPIFTVRRSDGTLLGKTLNQSALAREFPDLEQIIRCGFAGNDARLMTEQ